MLNVKAKRELVRLFAVFIPTFSGILAMCVAGNLMALEKWIDAVGFFSGGCFLIYIAAFLSHTLKK